MKINQLAVRFTDRDFMDTFRVMLEVYAMRLEEAYEDEEFTKEEICRDLNQLVFPIYQTFQNRNREDSYTQIKNIQRWLEIPKNSIYINEEVDKFCKDRLTLEDGGLWDNGEFHLIRETEPGDREYRYQAI
jgi:hypothetical protein